MKQEQGIIGKLVGGMIHRSVRKRYRAVYWELASQTPQPPCILYANHHSWMDGYLMFHLVTKLRLPSVDWIEEFDAFPLFAKVGGLRFAADDIAGRVTTIRRTIRILREGRSLVVFPEGKLHRPPLLLPFGRALEVVARNVPGVTLASVAIYQEASLHERPEAWLSVGEPHTYKSIADCEGRLSSDLGCLIHKVRSGKAFELLVNGTKDVNERMSMRGLRK